MGWVFVGATLPHRYTGEKQETACIWNICEKKNIHAVKSLFQKRTILPIIFAAFQRGRENSEKKNFFSHKISWILRKFTSGKSLFHNNRFLKKRFRRSFSRHSRKEEKNLEKKDSYLTKSSGFWESKHSGKILFRNFGFRKKRFRRDHFLGILERKRKIRRKKFLIPQNLLDFENVYIQAKICFAIIGFEKTIPPRSFSRHSRKEEKKSRENSFLSHKIFRILRKYTFRQKFVAQKSVFEKKTIIFLAF